MPLLPKHRVCLPICLTLGTLLCLHPAFPAFADVPASSGVTTVHTETQWQKVLLNHVTPNDIVAAQHWGRRSALPAGVMNVFGMQSANSLLVQATPAGFARLQELVKTLDIAPRSVQVRLVLARVTPSDLIESHLHFEFLPNPTAPKTLLGYATGNDAAYFVQTLQAQGNVLQSSDVFAFNDTEANISLAGGRPIPDLPALKSFRVAVTPHLSSDGSLTLTLHPSASWRVTGRTDLDGAPAVTTQDFQVRRTLKSGETLVITNLFPGAVEAGGDQIALFVTPAT